MKLYQQLARLRGAIENCRKANNLEWLGKHTDKLGELVREFMPHGSGFDNGVKFDEDKSTSERLIFHTSFHHMNEVGMYDGWTDHSVIVPPSLQFGFELRVTGRDRNDIKEYIAQAFELALSEDSED